MANDFTNFDAYIGTQGLIEYEDDSTKRQTQNLPPRPQRVDTGDNRFEARPEYGDWFAQGDFSGGAEQLRAHSPKSDDTKFYWSEGIDISKPGRLRLLWDTAALGSSDADVGHALEIADGLPFYFKNDAGTCRVYRLDGNFPPAEAAEDPHAGEGNQLIQDLASSGEELFAAITTNGIHRRNPAGTWSHYVAKPASSNFYRIEWLKDRLIAVDDGTVGTTGSAIYEITAGGAAPTPIETLEVGWQFTAIWDFGSFIYASAVHLASGRCNIHHYGSNQALSALEKKGETQMPHGQLVYSGSSYIGISYIGGGLKNKLGGLEPFVYQAIADAQGFLQLIKLVEREASSSEDLAVRAFEPFGESMFFSWTLGAEATVDSRNGLAVHHLARDAFAHHLEGGIENPTSIKVYKGRLLFVCAGDRLYYENVGTYPVLSANDSNYLITSVADFNNAGLKVWDLFEVAHSPLAAEEIVKVEYTTKHPDQTGVGAYTLVIDSATDGAEGEQEILTTNVKSRQLTVRLRIKPNDARTTAPEIYSFATRAVPAPFTNEYILTRTFRLLDVDRKDEQAEEQHINPLTVKNTLDALVNSWVVFAEAGQSWNALIKSVTDITPSTPIHRQTMGEDLRQGYIVQVQMIASKA